MAINSMDVDDVLMEYSIDCYFRQTWRDERLEYPIELGGEQISVAASMLNRIWRPDSFFTNGRKSYLHQITMPNRFVRIAHDGTVLFSSRLTIKAVCPMNLRKYPMDKQVCELIIGSFAYTVDDLIFQWKVSKGPISVRDDLQMAQYDSPEISFDKSFVMSPLHSGNVSRLHVHYSFERRMGFFLLELYVPCCLIVVLSWVSFWIDYKATNARVMLGVMTNLTMSTLGFSNRGSNAPRVSYATAVDYFVVTCFAFVFAALVEYAGVNYFNLLKIKLSGPIKGPVNEDGFPLEDQDEDDQQQPMGNSIREDSIVERSSNNNNRSSSQRHQQQQAFSDDGSSFHLLGEESRQRQLSSSLSVRDAELRTTSACSGRTSIAGRLSFNSVDDSDLTNEAPLGPSSSSFGYYHTSGGSFRRPILFASQDASQAISVEPALPNMRQSRFESRTRSRELTDAGVCGGENEQLVRSDRYTEYNDTSSERTAPPPLPSDNRDVVVVSQPAAHSSSSKRLLSFNVQTSSPVTRRQHTSFQLDTRQSNRSPPPSARQPNAKRSKRRWQRLTSIRRATLRRPAIFKPQKMVVSKIDEWCRRIFPLTFLILQIGFWISYKFIITD